MWVCNVDVSLHLSMKCVCECERQQMHINSRMANNKKTKQNKKNLKEGYCRIDSNQKQMNEYLCSNFNLIRKKRSNQKQFMPYAAATFLSLSTILWIMKSHRIAKELVFEGANKKHQPNTQTNVRTGTSCHREENHKRTKTQNKKQKQKNWIGKRMKETTRSKAAHNIKPNETT